ncbi:hypothetical protein DIS24_g5919 [Lasiodiplodia hormozganensis]|uniref:Aminoglycoside phosphotransferase domain-containing protein n=1 Tax=Lasiodiplodia hormozganensis TaxID=869390 RepID=A0AA39YJB2_9PEZI|nr:hypothetical protein DIS24_g5919 [Lasiodiplodia hormozganensis]
MTVFDEIAVASGDAEYHSWIKKVIAAKDEVVEFVARKRGGSGAGLFDGYLKGSFNLCICVKFNNGLPKTIIRFPKPGHTATALVDEKVANEASLMNYLAQKTTIPVPRVLTSGSTDQSPRQLGPFIIMDFIDGTRLSTLLKQPTAEGEDVILDPAIDDAKLDRIYHQVAGYMLQLAELDFDGIGAISESPVTSKWSVRSRPLTYNMNELATVSGYPVDRFPRSRFESVADYFRNLTSEHLTHLETQRNLATDPDDAGRRFLARHRLRELIPRYCIDNSGPFKLFCDDLQPSNMLVDPDTLQITAVLDLEFTNAMPAQFAYDPPWWLLLLGPDMWLEKHSLHDFLTRYEPRLEQFLRAMERVEKESPSPRLSARMRDAWATKRFWFDYAIRKSFDVDTVYWTVLCGEDDGMGVEASSEMEEFKQRKMEQLSTYEEEYAALM